MAKKAATLKAKVEGAETRAPRTKKEGRVYPPDGRTRGRDKPPRQDDPLALPVCPVSIREAARRANTSYWTVLRMVKDGRLKSVKFAKAGQHVDWNQLASMFRE
jgi:excisionase family DNA binding protein